jgi:hypothetical protein
MSKKVLKRWTANDVALLSENLNENPSKLVRLFPTRTYSSILSKKHHILKLIAQSKIETTQTKLNFDSIYSQTPNQAIEDIDDILSQSLIKVEELTIENSKLMDKIKKLEEKLSKVSNQYESQKGKVEALATESKSKWSLIKKVFFE